MGLLVSLRDGLAQREDAFTPVGRGRFWGTAGNRLTMESVVSTVTRRDVDHEPFPNILITDTVDQ